MGAGGSKSDSLQVHSHSSAYSGKKSITLQNIMAVSPLNPNQSEIRIVSNNSGDAIRGEAHDKIFCDARLGDDLKTHVPSHGHHFSGIVFGDIDGNHLNVHHLTDPDENNTIHTLVRLY